IALARDLAARDLSGSRAIELGCGIGLPSIVALNRGACVLATDHYRAALDFAAYNARINAGRDLSTALLDWHAPPAALGSFDLVVAADVLYEERNAAALARLVPRLLDSGGEAVFADPRREHARAFVEAMEGRGFEVRTGSVVVEREGRSVEVSLHSFRRG
ncbi:MAG: methyltransferase domain-containing protein, partial [Actinomycetota bacterium]